MVWFIEDFSHRPEDLQRPKMLSCVGVVLYGECLVVLRAISFKECTVAYVGDK